MENPKHGKAKPPFPPQGQEPPGIEQEMEPQPQYEAVGYRPAGKLEGRTALITGGDSGIGRAVAILFAREGADVAIVYLPEEQADAEATRALVREQGKECLCLAGDVRDKAFCRRAAEQTAETFGKLDLLVNNAAYQRHRDSIEEVSEEQWETTFETNIHGYFHMVKAALPFLGEGAAIINTGSATAFGGSARLLDYSSTKGAIHTFTKSLAQSLFDRGIRVNCVAPGPVWTPLNPAERSAEDVRGFGEGIPAGRPAQPGELAPAYVFLASGSDSGFISGEVLRVLGGATSAG